MIRRASMAGILFCALFFQAWVCAEETPEDGKVQLLIRANPNGAAKLSFKWKQLEGPDVTIENPVAAKFEGGKWVSETYFIAKEPGKYIFEVTVINEDGVESKGKVVREVLPPTPPPVAVAGKDQNDKLVGEIVRINGVGSKAAEGLAITEWKWKLFDSPERFKGIDAKLLSERSFDFKASQPGTYQFELKVFDGKRWSAASSMRVTVKPDSAPPKIEEAAEQPKKIELPPTPKLVEIKRPEVKVMTAPGATLKLGETVVLDGSKSVIDENAKPEFYWRTDKGFVRDLIADRSKPFSKARSDVMNYPLWTCKPNQPGEYRFVLDVTTYDANGKNPIHTESESVVFILVAPEPPPEIKKPVQPEVAVVAPPKENKTDAAGTTVELPKEDPPPKNPPVKTTKPAVEPPIAKIFVERATVDVGETVKLDGSKSKDPNGAKLEFVWGPVPGKRAPKSWGGKDGPHVEFLAEEEGEYVVALIVKSEGGVFSEPAQAVITVGAANQPPKLKIPKSIEGLIGEQIRIDAEATDPENDKLSYKWESVDPPNLVMRDQHGKDMSINPQLVFVPARAGAYVFKCTVTDSKGGSDSAQVMIGVKERINRPPVAILEGPKTVGTGGHVKISAARSSDPEKKPLTYLWSQESQPGDPKIPGEVPKERDKTWEFTPTEAGHYLISLIVSDGVNKSDPERFELTVTVNNNAPVGNISGPAGGRVTINESVTLDATASSDADNDKLTFKWKRGEGKGDVELIGIDQDKCVVKAKAVGPVRIELVVNDGKVDSDPTFFDLLVTRINGKPVAKITGPDSAKLGTFVDLSGAESSDPDADEITFVWSQSADGGPEIGVRSKELRKKSLRFRADKPGTYIIALEVVDSEGAKSDPVTHKVEVKGANKAPHAMASRVGTEPIVAGAEVKLSARGSLDPEGGVLKYKWKQLSGDPIQLPEEGAEILNLAPKAPGNYEFELVVSDGENDSAPAHVAFNVKGPNTIPVAVINDVVTGEVGERITLDGSASRDADGDKLEYKWSQVSGPEAKWAWRGMNKPRTEVVLPKDDEYVFELKVFDGKEWSEPRQVALKTRSQNVAPLASVAATEVRSEENTEVVLDASASSDPDKGPRPLSFVWRQLTGTPRVELHSEGPIARFTPKRAGTLTFEVRANDGKADSPPAVVSVEVLKAGSLPVAIAEAQPTTLKAAQKGNKDDPNILILDGTKSQTRNAGAPTLTYTWKQIGGDDLRLRAAELSKKRVGMRIFVPGNYRFMLTVSDGQNTSAPAYIDVKVIGNGPPEETAPGAGAEKPPKAEAKPRPAPAARESAESKTSKPAPSVVQSSGEEGALLPPPKDSPGTAGKEPNAIQKAISDLAANVDPAAERQLVQTLSSTDAESRSTAAAAMVRRGINSIPALIGVLDSPEQSGPAKKEAAWALRELTHETLGLDAAKWKQWWLQQPASKSVPLPVTDK